MFSGVFGWCGVSEFSSFGFLDLESSLGFYGVGFGFAGSFD